MLVNSLFSSNSSNLYTASSAFKTNPESKTAASKSSTEVVTSVTKTESAQISDSKKNSSTDKTIDKKTNNTKDSKQSAVSETSVRFKLHKGTGTTVIQIIDQTTGKVIKEIPPESILDSVAQIWKNAGINVDQKA